MDRRRRTEKSKLNSLIAFFRISSVTAGSLSSIIRFSFIGIVILSCIYAVNQINLSRYFPIKTVRVYGLNHVDVNEVQTMLVPMVSHGFFTINIEHMRDRLLQMPWVSDIFVRRYWPDVVEVTIIEKKAIARWNQESLLSDAGVLFQPRDETVPKHLPEVKGPTGQHIHVLQQFNEINRQLKPIHASISHLELTPHLTWKVSLNNGMMLFAGYQDILTRLDQFVKVYPKIVGDRATDVEYVDLRYPNGLAVRWKT